MIGWPTLRDAPSFPLNRVRCRDWYGILVAELYQRERDTTLNLAFPRSFDPASEHCHWRRLWHDCRNNQSPSRSEIRWLFRAPTTPALPLRARQVVYQTLTCGLALGHRVGGASSCPVCAAHGVHTKATHEHVILTCPLASVVWLHFCASWLALSGDAWAREVVEMVCGASDGDVGVTQTRGPLTSSGAPTATVRRQWRGRPVAQPAPGVIFTWPADARLALVLGARPEGARGYEHAFSLARGIMVEAIVSFHMGAGLAHAQGTPSPAADFIAAAAGVYMKGRKSLQAAVAHEHARMLMLGKWRRRAGCKQRSIDSPRQNWETRWLGSGAARDPNGHSGLYNSYSGLLETI